MQTFWTLMGSCTLCRKESTIMKSIYLKALLEETKRCVGFPVSSLAYTEDGNILLTASNSVGCGQTSHKTHAEYKMLNDPKFKNYTGKLTLLITFPPCSHCLAELNNSKKDIKIKYLFDVWGKRIRNYIKVQNTSIKQVNISTVTIDEIWSIIERRYEKPGHRLSKNLLLKKHNSKKIMRMSPRK